MSSNSGVPVTIQGLTVQSGSGAQAQISQSQANKILQHIRSMQSSGNVPQTIKIQAVATNPNTGARQLVAIPIPSSSGSGIGGNQTITVNTVNNTASPVKVIRVPSAATSSGSGFGGQGANEILPGVKVVKISAAQAGSTNTRTVYSPQVCIVDFEKICPGVSAKRELQLIWKFSFVV